MMNPQYIKSMKSFFTAKEVDKINILVLQNSTTSKVCLSSIRQISDPSVSYSIGHDSNMAPYIIIKHNDNSVEAPDTWHISLTDEHSLAGAVVAHSPSGSPLAGVGMDIASISDFLDSNPKFDKRFFKPGELEYLSSFDEAKLPYARTTLFSLKEAALKTLADSMRPYVAEHEGLFDYVEFRKFEIKIIDDHFAEAYPTNEAKETADFLGIRRFREIYFLESSYIFSLAKALYF